MNLAFPRPASARIEVTSVQDAEAEGHRPLRGTLVWDADISAFQLLREGGSAAMRLLTVGSDPVDLWIQGSELRLAQRYTCQLAGAAEAMRFFTHLGGWVGSEAPSVLDDLDERPGSRRRLQGPQDPSQDALRGRGEGDLNMEGRGAMESALLGSGARSSWEPLAAELPPTHNAPRQAPPEGERSVRRRILGKTPWGQVPGGEPPGGPVPGAAAPVLAQPTGPEGTGEGPDPPLRGREERAEGTLPDLRGGSGPNSYPLGGAEEATQQVGPDPLGEGAAVLRGATAYPRSVNEAAAWLTAKLGPGWRGQLHASHHLVVWEPLLYCSRCGKHAMSHRHLLGLRDRCGGPPGYGSVYLSRLRHIGEGRHPTVHGLRLEGGPIPIPTRLLQPPAP